MYVLLERDGSGIASYKGLSPSQPGSGELFVHGFYDGAREFAKYFYVIKGSDGLDYETEASYSLKSLAGNSEYTQKPFVIGQRGRFCVSKQHVYEQQGFLDEECDGWSEAYKLVEGVVEEVRRTDMLRVFVRLATENLQVSSFPWIMEDRKVYDGIVTLSIRPDGVPLFKSFEPVEPKDPVN